MHSGTVQEKTRVEKDSDTQSQLIKGPPSLLKGLILARNSTKDPEGSKLHDPNKAPESGLRSRSDKSGIKAVQEENTPALRAQEGKKPSPKETFLASPLLNKHTCLGC